jgi:NADH dehydrogenase
MTKTKSRVVVLGGGYAGVLAANHLRLRADDTDITLVNARPLFVERIRLHQLVTGSDDAVVDYQSVLGGGIRLVVDSATVIDAQARTVALASGATLSYDYLIYAVGSTGAIPSVPGAEFAYPISELEHAQDLRAALASAAATAPLVVVGAGPTGIETAAELAERGRNVTLVCGRVLGPYLSAPGRRSIARRLAKLSVAVLDGPGATVTAVTKDAVTLADGQELPSAITIWSAGFGVPDLAARSGLSTDALGRLLTDETLTSVDDPRIIAAGDASAPSGQPLRMSCQAALPLGAQAANTVLSRIAGTQPATISQAFTGQCISVGRNAGTIQIARTDDTVLPLYVGGRVGASIKEAVCKGTISFLTREARKPGSYFWLKGGKRQQHLAAAEAARASAE